MMKKNEYSGHVSAMPLSEHEAAASMTVEEFLERTVAARSFLPKAKNDPLTQRVVDEMEELHDLIQRDLTGQKLKNARTELPTYITEEWLPEPVDGPSPGVMPPFVVVTPTGLDFIDEEETKLGIRAGQKFIIEDGESRGEAFLWLLEQSDTPEEIVATMLQKRIAVVIHHGVPVETAGKWFSDINGRGIGVNANLIVARDYTDPYRDAALAVFPEVGAPLEEKARQVKATGPEVFTVLQARLAVTALVKGAGAVGYGAGRIPQNGTDFAKLEQAATEWFKFVFDTLGVQAFKDKANVLRSVPMLVAIGAVGRPYYDGDASAKRAARTVIADQTIDWTVGKHWDGICGKVNPNTGNFAVGSAKEYGNAAVNALTKVGADVYNQIRSPRETGLRDAAAA
jgi:hypothetical protein